MTLETRAPYAKPLPRPSAESKPFWDAALSHRLTIQKCRSCGRFWFPPSQRCAHCLSPEHDWVEVAGTGRVFSFVTYHRLYHPGWEGDVPYVVAVVELDEGPRLLTGIVGCPPEAVSCDLRVRVAWDDVTPEVTLPKFAPL